MNGNNALLYTSAGLSDSLGLLSNVLRRIAKQVIKAYTVAPNCLG